MNILLNNIVGKTYALNANEASVYAAIDLFSKKDGLYISYQTLAIELPFKINAKTIERAVHRLTKLGLIERRGNALFTTTNCPSTPQTISPAAQTDSPAPQTNCSSQTDKLSHIDNKDINKERVETLPACDTIATPIPSTPSSFVQNASFDLLLKAFKAHNPNNRPVADILAAARTLWDELPDYKHNQLLQAIQDGSWNKPRLDWLISDFPFREPINYAGISAPQGEKLFLVPLAPNQKGLFTEKDVKEFNLPNPEPFDLNG